MPLDKCPHQFQAKYRDASFSGKSGNLGEFNGRWDKGREKAKSWEGEIVHFVSFGKICIF